MKEYVLKDKNLDVIVVKGFLNNVQSNWMLNYCIKNIVWGQDKYNFGGREVLAPRLTSLYGNHQYSYSGNSLQPRPFTEALLRLGNLVSEKADDDYNIVLLNQYRNGQDSVSWHTDAEPSLGTNPSIGSISLGQTREFKIRDIGNKKNIHSIFLGHGDLIIMQGNTQHYWEHSIPKTKKYNELRINLTFRKIL